MSAFVSADLACIARRPACGMLVALVCAAGALGLTPVVAQPTVPDFAVNGETAWFPIGDEFLPPPGGGPGPVTFDRRYPYVSNAAARRAGIQPTYRVADLSNPILQPWAVEQMRKANEAVLAGKVPYRARERCHPAGVPGFVVYTLAEPVYFIQTPKQLIMINQGGPEVRRVYLNVPHSANVKPSWYGESVGHYEGDTLVIDTIGLNTKTFVDYYRTPHTEKLHVVERWRMVEDGKAMEVVFKVEDTDTYYKPWSGMRRFRRVEREFVEQICAEGNRNLFDYKIPVANTPDF
jgi:hypothetical protein